MDKIAVLTPCYNEERTIAKVIDDFKKELPEAVIYVYDNNSTDNTVNIAKEHGAVVRYEYQQGKGNVIRRMFREIEAKCYLMINGDDTYPASHAREMINYILTKNKDMVIGDRLSSTYFKENKRLFHNSGNKFVKWLINFLFKSDIKNIMTGYRAFSRPFVKLFPVMSSGFQIETEMIIHALDKRFDLYEVKDRSEGGVSKLNTYSNGMKVLKTIFILFKEYRPLGFFSLLALLLFLIAVILFIPILVEYFKIGLVPRFPTLIMSVFFALASIQSLFSGFILDIIAQKERKSYEIQRNNLK